MIKWLYPGMKVKRWLGLLGLGVVLCSLAIAMGLAWAYRTIAVPPLVSALVQTATLQFIPHPYRELVIGLPGLLVVGVALYRLSRSILTAIMPAAATPGLSLAERVYNHSYATRGPRIVVIGGGTGLSTMLRGLKKYSGNLTAILTVGDDGGSTGRLRRDLGMLPPGDFRNCIVALADAEPMMEKLFQYRFAAGSGLEGHSFGNLFIVAMLGVTGDFEQAVAETARVLAVRGQVYPSTLANVTVCAELADGAVVVGESRIGEQRGAIARVFLQPATAAGYPEALRAILDADLIILGPGSLYTSILPNLLVEDVARAVRLASAPTVYVCNVATQRGETDAFGVEEHVGALTRHVGAGVIDDVLVNDNLAYTEKIKPEWGVAAVAAGAGVTMVEGARVVRADVVNAEWPLRHDPDKLARALLRLWQERTKGGDKIVSFSPAPDRPDAADTARDAGAD